MPITFDSPTEVSVEQATGIKAYAGALWEGTVVSFTPEMVKLIHQIRPGTPGTLEGPQAPAFHQAEFTYSMLRLPATVTEYTQYLVLSTQEAPFRSVQRSWHETQGRYGFFLRLAEISPKREDRIKPFSTSLLVPFDAVVVRSTVRRKQEYVPGEHYDAADFEIAAYRAELRRKSFQQMDFSVDGFSNKPTAVLGLGLGSDARWVRELQRLKACSVKNKITVAAFKKMLKTFKLYDLVASDDYVATPFDEFKLEINFQELVGHFNQTI